MAIEQDGIDNAQTDIPHASASPYATKPRKARTSSRNPRTQIKYSMHRAFLQRSAEAKATACPSRATSSSFTSDELGGPGRASTVLTKLWPPAMAVLNLALLKARAKESDSMV